MSGKRSKASGCSVGVDPGDPALPVAGQGSLSGVRASKNSRRRAGVLIAVHVAIAAHATHYLIAGRTLSPVEPSESMYTLELGQLNAGFIFFAVALLATALFGRFFCGWGCHLVALQDLCAWMMKKVGIRPRPFRSRLLLYGPLILALYMFVWPTLLRFGRRMAHSFGWTDLTPPPFLPALENHLLTDAFWKTFPGPTFAVLTLLACGFLAVYLLGAKGFCTYGCPYGAFFVFADRISPGRIVVNDDCEQCGHCTVTCTSNVTVHEEVARYGQVVDPGCMKCLDCVSVCPKDALSWKFAPPPAFRRPSRETRHARKSSKFPLTTGEEVFAAAACAVGTLTFRGLYDGPPLLMSLGLGAMTAFAALKLLQLGRRANVRMQNLTLKRSGALARGGKLFAVIAGLWLVFAAHSGFVQWQRAWGVYHLDRTEAQRAEVMAGSASERTFSDRHYRSAERADRHFSLADRWGLFDVLEIKRGLAWTSMLAEDFDEAELRLRQAVAMAPDAPRLHDDLVDLLAARGKAAELADALENKIVESEATVGDRCRMAVFLAQSGEMERAAVEYEECVRLQPDHYESRYNLGGILRRLGRPQEAVPHLAAAAELAPGDPDTQIELGLALAASGNLDRAIDALRRAIELDPDSPEATMHLPNVIRDLEQQRSSAGP